MSTLSSTALRVRFALVWSLLMLGVLGAFSAPLLLNGIDFPFWTHHIVFIVVFLSAVRYIFFLRHSWLADKQALKVAIFFLCLWGGFLLANAVYDFRTYADETGLESFLAHLPNAEQTPLLTFIVNEMLFFGTASVISVAVLGLRMIHSVWRFRNRGKA